MKVKFNRGPRNGQREVARSESDYKFLVQHVPSFKQLGRAPDDYDFTIEIRTGEYHKSHRRLKDGTVIFEWMGWLDGKV